MLEIVPFCGMKESTVRRDKRGVIRIFKMTIEAIGLILYDSFNKACFILAVQAGFKSNVKSISDKNA